MLQKELQYGNRISLRFRQSECLSQPSGDAANCRENRDGVAYIPVLLGGVFKATGNASPAVTLQGIKNKLTDCSASLGQISLSFLDTVISLQIYQVDFIREISSFSV